MSKAAWQRRTGSDRIELNQIDQIGILSQLFHSQRNQCLEVQGWVRHTMQSQTHAVNPPVIPLTALLRPGTALQLPQLFLCSMGTPERSKPFSFLNLCCVPSWWGVQRSCFVHSLHPRTWGEVTDRGRYRRNTAQKSERSEEQCADLLWWCCMEELPAHLVNDVPSGGDGVEGGTKPGQGEGEPQYVWVKIREHRTKGKTRPRDKRIIQRQSKEWWQGKSKSVQGQTEKTSLR